MQSNMSAEVFNRINRKLSKLPKTETQRSIHRVHKHLRDVNEKAYEPEIIAIGPYHHGKDSLKMMEEHKVRYLELLLKNDGQKQNVDTYISAIGQLEQKARDCYAEPIDLSGAEFVEMLILDGCFIIELVRKCHDRDPTCKNDPIFQMQWITSSLRRDLILFENQIPFFVLCKLFDLIEGQNQHHTLIHNLLKFCSYHNFPQSEGISRDTNLQEIKHLLDLVYSSWFSSTAPPENEQSPSSETGIRLLDLVYSSCFSSTDHPIDVAAPLICSATELKNANVEFCSKKCNTLFDVEFKNGLMEMPSFTVEDWTECFLRNLVVYEQYFLNHQQNPVTDYTTLLDCLINSSKDVEILSQFGIIDNYLGDNEAVAKIINRLGDLVTCDDKHFVYDNLFAEVNKHYKKGWNRSMARLRRDIFYSRWAYISFFAGVIILVLTIVQAVCSVLERL